MRHLASVLSSSAYVRQVRDRLGLTQAALAERLGVSFVTVNRWENGKAEPSGLALQRLQTLDTSTRPTAPPISKPPQTDFLADATAVRLVVESERLSYGYLANPAFAIETSRVDPLPHQRIAVYEY